MCVSGMGSPPMWRKAVYFGWVWFIGLSCAFLMDRTKLKQTEVDCEYLKRCCETLSEENRRLQKELQELRALKASNSNPFFMQLPATTLTMCPSCERLAPNNSSNNNNNNSPSSSKPVVAFPFAKPKFYPFPHSKPHQS